MNRIAAKIAAAFILLIILPACGSSPAPRASQPDRLQVVATTTIIGDVVRNVGGETVNVEVLLPVDTDPHSFDPSPQDVAKVARAELVFANGAGLEEFLEPMLNNAGGEAELIYLSDGIQLLEAPDLHGEQQESQGEDEHEHADGDPHTWFDPNNVILWTQTIQDRLSALDPANAQAYASNAQTYSAQLQDLDAWILEQVARVPAANRQLVTDHDSFTYFADRYGFKLVGAVIPGYSTLAQPSAQELAGLEDAIRSLNVKAIFVGTAVNPVLSQRVAQDTGTQLVYLYTESLTGPEGPASNYLDFMRYNVTAIVEALQD